VGWGRFSFNAHVLSALEIIGNLRRKKGGSFLKVTTLAFRNRGQECGI
jgi:hypothetical protein